MDERTQRQSSLVSNLEQQLKSKTARTTTSLPDLGTYSENDPDFASKQKKIEEWFQATSKKVLSDTQQLNQKIQPYLEIATLSGRFSPEDLFINNTDITNKEAILSEVAKNCNIETSDKVQWCIIQGRRKEVLQSMVDDGTIIDKVKMPLPITDKTGNMLRRIILEGNSIQPGQLSLEELQSCLVVIEMTREVNFPKPAEDEVRQLINSKESLRYFSSITTGFIGRQIELQRLNAFLDKPVLEDWDGFLVTGLGGVGKSALLAKFVEDVISQKKATAVVLDFDRPGIDPTDSFWLDLEVSRQIGLQYPNLDKQLSELRQNIRNIKIEETGSLNFGSESQESLRYSKDIIAEAKVLLLQNDNGDKPFLVVLDTIEEVTQRLLSYKVHDWILNLWSVLQPIRLKVIFSGRLFEHSYDEIKRMDNNMESMAIEEFDNEIAAKFLEQNSVTKDEVTALLKSELIPKRPLELKLMAKLLTEGSITVDELLKDLSDDTAKDKTSELFAGIIYRRVLMRIGEESLRDIASPGLILRYLTPELIVYVLSPALKLNISTIEDAQKITDQLSSYNWLCYKDADNRIWHRKDLRRSMLTFMIAQEPEKVRTIREMAIAWLDGIHSIEAKAESIYHRLMNMKIPATSDFIPMSDLHAAAPFIMTDIADLPKPAAVLLRYAQDGKINEDELPMLPDAYFKDRYEDTCKHLVTSRQFLLAHKLFTRGTQISNKNIFGGESIIDRWDKELLFSLGEWEAIRSLPTYQRHDFSSRLQCLVNYVFPSALINAGDIEIKILGSLVTELAKSKDLYSTNSFGPETATLLYRLGHSLVLLIQTQKLSDSIIKSCREIIDKLKMEVESALLERGMLLLHLLCYKKPPDHYLLSTSLVKLDPDWITRLKNETSPNEGTILDVILLAMTHDVSEREVHSKLWLSNVDGAKVKLSNRDRKIQIDLSKLEFSRFTDLVNGPDSVFRDPCRYAILEAFPDQRSYETLAQIIQDVIYVKLTDLDPGKFSETMTNSPETALEPFIEIIDRSWSMGSFLKMSCDAKPEAKKLKTVFNAYLRWQSSFSALLEETKNIKRD